MEQGNGVFWCDYEISFLRGHSVDSFLKHLFDALFYPDENCFWLHDARHSRRGAYYGKCYGKCHSVMGSGPSVSLDAHCDPVKVEQFFRGLDQCGQKLWPLGFFGWIDYEVGVCLSGLDCPPQSSFYNTGQSASSWIDCNRAICIEWNTGHLRAVASQNSPGDPKSWLRRASILIEKLLSQYTTTSPVSGISDNSPEDATLNIGACKTAQSHLASYNTDAHHVRTPSKPGTHALPTVAPRTKTLLAPDICHPGTHGANSGIYTAEVKWLHSDKQYLQLISKVLTKIQHGDIYQACLTNRLVIDNTAQRLALPAFYNLVRISPTQYCAYIKIDQREFISSSPELFLRLADGILATEPIKGTRPRGSSAAEDIQLSLELANSAKERAENLMIVDLMRNDFSKICSFISVDYMHRVKTYENVHHLVSRVIGRLNPGCGLFDILQATFPAGSVTGAPKIAAIKLLYDLEKARRGVYSGAFGYISKNNICLAMSIRSAMFCDRTISIGSGGGVVLDSDPEFELAEVKLKAAALLRAIFNR